MMKVPLKIATLLLLLSLCPNQTPGQEQADDTLNGYAIHATYHDLTIFFNAMRGPGYQGGGGISTPPALVVKTPPKDSERVSYIGFNTIRQGELWRVTVSVKFGEFFDQGEKEIAVYQIREGEKAEVKELAQYGIQPLDVSVVRIQRVPVIKPSVINLTSSISVLSIKTAPRPMPYLVTLKNTSGKAVQALELVTSNGRGMRTLQWPEGTLDRPLIEAGQSYQTEMLSEREHKSLPTSGYVSEQLQVIEINTVVFTDGTYEGNPMIAAYKNADALGYRLQLDRVLSLIRTSLETADDDFALAQFKNEVSLLDETVEPGIVEELINRFWTLNDSQKISMHNIVRRKLHDIKYGLIRGIAEFERGSEKPAKESFRHWLERVKKKYEKWRSKLPGQDSN